MGSTATVCGLGVLVRLGPSAFGAKSGAQPRKAGRIVVCEKVGDAPSARRPKDNTRIGPNARLAERRALGPLGSPHCRRVISRSGGLASCAPPSTKYGVFAGGSRSKIDRWRPGGLQDFQLPNPAGPKRSEGEGSGPRLDASRYGCEDWGCKWTGAA